MHTCFKVLLTPSHAQKSRKYIVKDNPFCASHPRMEVISTRNMLFYPPHSNKLTFTVVSQLLFVLCWNARRRWMETCTSLRPATRAPRLYALQEKGSEPLKESKCCLSCGHQNAYLKTQNRLCERQKYVLTNLEETSRVSKHFHIIIIDL